MASVHASHPVEIPASRSVDIPTGVDAPGQSAGATVLTAGLSLLAVLGIFAGAAALIGFALRGTLAFFTG